MEVYMSSESILFNSGLSENDLAPKEGNAFCIQALKFSLAATVILPIVGQIISLGQLTRNRREYTKANLSGKICFVIAFLMNFIYVGAVLYLFSNRPTGLPPAY
jgi:Mn2+/Fe2+ NRAMP family transporter